MRYYVALIHKDAESDYGVSFPDFPGCISAGGTLDEARDLAHEALAFHLEGMAEDGLSIPDPSPLEAVMADPENRDGVAILVAVPNPRAKPVEVSITLPEDMLQEIDHHAERQGFTRSGFLAQAARRAMSEAA